PSCDAHGQPRGCTNEAVKAAYIGTLTKSATEAYSTILTRYPVMDRSDDASRRQATAAQILMGLVKKGPDVSRASKVGEPPVVDPPAVSAIDVTQEEN